VTESAVLKPTSKVKEAAPAASASEEIKISIVQALTGIIVRPVDMFQRLRDAKHGHWWLVLVITLLTVALSGYASSTVMSRAFQSIELPGNGAVITGGATMSGPAVQFAGPSPLMQIGLPLIGGLTLTLADYLLRTGTVFAMSLVLGGKATFRQAFRMSVWTTIPYAVRHIVQSIAMFTTGGQAVNGLSAVLTTAEVRAIPILNLVLGYIDFYMLWSAILLGIGAVVTAKMSKGKGLAVMVAYLGLALASGLIMFAISGALSGLMGGGGAGPQRFGGGLP
jgi:hypothetical protein